MLLGIPIALIARYGLAHPLPVGTKTVLALAACTPFLFVGLADATHVQMMCPAMIICFAWFLKVLAEAAPDAPGAFREGPGPAAALA